MRLKLQLPAKAGRLRISECEAVRLITLPANDFQAFLNWPRKEKCRGIQPSYYEEDGKRIYRGVLILGEGRGDGVFAYDAGEHFAYLPNMRGMVDSILPFSPCTRTAGSSTAMWLSVVRRNMLCCGCWRKIQICGKPSFAWIMMPPESRPSAGSQKFSESMAILKLPRCNPNIKTGMRI